MRNDFAIFITTHERPNDQRTLDWFLKSGYTGKYYLVIDNMDKCQTEYLDKYGTENVLVFDKKKYWEICDTFNNRQHLAAVLYARQFVEDTAREMGLKSFLVLDDDISLFAARMPKNGKMSRYTKVKANDFVEAYVKFLFQGGFASINPGTQNLYMGGEETIEKFPRKGSNAFFRNVEIPIKWISAMNEDIITCIEYNKKCIKMCTAVPICCETPKAGTGKADGGMKEIYKNMTDYERAFYAVIADPARCYVKMNRTKDGHQLRIARNWSGGDPCILNERWRKKRDEK